MKITLEVDTEDVTQLRAARELIAAQLRMHGDPPSEHDVVTALEAMWPEVGDGPKRLLNFAAMSFDPDQPFTFEQLRLTLGLNVESVRAFHRNLARSLKARGIELEDVMPSHDTGAQKTYRLPLAIHTTIRALPYGA
jgi:hypothetical protein